jgi:hypothetical protein
MSRNGYQPVSIHSALFPAISFSGRAGGAIFL